MRFLLDSSSVIAMARAGKMDLLRGIVRRAYITRAVREELMARDDETTAAIRPALSGWITTLRGPAAPSEYLALGLHEGEASIIAAGRGEDMLVIDEKQGRALAEALGLNYVGLLGLLLEGARQGRIQREEALEALDALERVGFWIAPHLSQRFRLDIGSEEE